MFLCILLTRPFKKAMHSNEANEKSNTLEEISAKLKGNEKLLESIGETGGKCVFLYITIKVYYNKL